MLRPRMAHSASVIRRCFVVPPSSCVAAKGVSVGGKGRGINISPGSEGGRRERASEFRTS